MRVWCILWLIVKRQLQYYHPRKLLLTQNFEMVQEHADEFAGTLTTIVERQLHNESTLLQLESASSYRHDTLSQRIIPAPWHERKYQSFFSYAVYFWTNYFNSCNFSVKYQTSGNQLAQTESNHDID
ncbi:uncharacterized protein LOC144638771 [Oculina patagonica]